MDQETKDWYESQFEMFGTEGWKNLLNQLMDIIDNTDTISNIKTEQELNFKRGELSILNWLVKWQSAVEENFKELTHETNA